MMNEQYGDLDTRIRQDQKEYASPTDKLLYDYFSDELQKYIVTRLNCYCSASPIARLHAFEYLFSKNCTFVSFFDGTITMENFNEVAYISMYDCEIKSASHIKYHNIPFSTAVYEFQRAKTNAIKQLIQSYLDLSNLRTLTISYSELKAYIEEDTVKPFLEPTHIFNYKGMSFKALISPCSWEQQLLNVEKTEPRIGNLIPVFNNEIQEVMPYTTLLEWMTHFNFYDDLAFAQFVGYNIRLDLMYDEDHSDLSAQPLTRWYLYKQTNF
jgi:hypothetical protein